MSADSTVAIVGGGFSGTLTAINLARHGGPRAVLIERSEAVARGAAYRSSGHPHLLNVRAGNMSAYPDEPTHFQQWLERRGGDPQGFARRADYGEYLAEELALTRQRFPNRISMVQGNAAAAQPDAQSWRLDLTEGRVISADSVVLACGNLPPVPPPGINPGNIPAETWIGDPWNHDQVAAAADGRPVLLLGTGLTMVDTALALARVPQCGAIHALSRRGLLPQSHAIEPPPPKLDAVSSYNLRSIFRATRQAAESIGWRRAVDQLRPHTQSIWQRLEAQDRRRFLKHLRPWWDVHRHRVSPEIAEELNRLISSGRLRIHAGRLENTEPIADGVRVSWQIKGTAARVALDFGHLINCTGPAPINRNVAEPLLRHLLENGIVGIDPHGLGLAVDQHSRVLNPDGKVVERMHALGSMTRGTFWEISAVPDIRVQVWTLARRLANAHWVGGEGL